MADGFEDGVNGLACLPLGAILGVVAGPGAVEAQEAGEAGRAELTPENPESMALELLVRHLFEGGHDRRSLLQDRGFATEIRAQHPHSRTRDAV